MAAMITDDLKSIEEDCIKRGIPFIEAKKGRWLANKIKDVKPRKVLELGTANGYSGIILGSEGAELTTVEIDPKIACQAKNNFVRFNIKARVVVADAVEAVSSLTRDENNDQAFDLIFIDFAKKRYINILSGCLQLVKEGGLIIADNVNMEKCSEFKETILKHPKLKTEIIEIGDGLSCSVKV